MEEINQSISHDFLEWPTHLEHCYVHYRQCVDAQVWDGKGGKSIEGVDLNLLVFWP